MREKEMEVTESGCNIEHSTELEIGDGTENRRLKKRIGRKNITLRAALTTGQTGL